MSCHLKLEQALAVVGQAHQVPFPRHLVKAVLGFTHFSLRGLDKVAGEWDLVSLAYNCKRLLKLEMA